MVLLVLLLIDGEMTSVTSRTIGAGGGRVVAVHKSMLSTTIGAVGSGVGDVHKSTTSIIVETVDRIGDATFGAHIFITFCSSTA